MKKKSNILLFLIIASFFLIMIFLINLISVISSLSSSEGLVLQIINPNEGNPKDVSSGENIPIYFNFSNVSNAGVNISSGVSIDSVFIGGINCSFVKNPLIKNSNYYNPSAVMKDVTSTKGDQPTAWVNGFKTVPVLNQNSSLAFLDNVNWTLMDGKTSDVDLLATFNFTISEPVQNINSIEIWITAGTNSSLTAEDIRPEIAYFSNNTWMSIGPDFRARKTINVIYTKGFDKIIRGNQLMLALQGLNIDSGESIMIDYVKIRVNSSKGGDVEYAYIPNTGWNVNVTVPPFTSGLKNLFVNASYLGTTKEDTEVNAINYGVEHCTDTCSSKSFTCGTQTICGASVNCGTCSDGYTCQVNGTCIINPCTDTCSSKSFTCGTQTICGASVNCGTCSDGYTCQVNGTCIINPCTDTCSSKSFTCGTQTICGASVNCGTCSDGYTCQVNGTCIINPCTDTCSSKSFTCGTQTICGASVNCGTCSDGYTCQVNGTCINNNYTQITPGINFKMCLVRNKELNNSLSLTDSTKLVISSKNGQVITVNNLPNYDMFDQPGWVAMLVDQNKTNTIDPTPTGDYLYKYFCTIDRTAKTLNFTSGGSLSSWKLGDTLILYNPFVNYEFVGNQLIGPLITASGAPAWRAGAGTTTTSVGGPMFRRSDGVYIWMINGFNGAAYHLGYAYSNNMTTWTMGNSDYWVFGPENISDTSSVYVSGPAIPLNDGTGRYYCLITQNIKSTGHSALRILYFDENLTNFTYSAPIIADYQLGYYSGSIIQFNGYYHLLTLLVTSSVPDRAIVAAKSSNLEGPYTVYQNIVRGNDSNNGTAWSYAVDGPVAYDDGTKIFGFFGCTSQWSQSGTKGNREHCLLNFNKTTETWSINDSGPVIINPFYYQDISGTYNWAGDHVGANPIYL